MGEGNSAEVLDRLQGVSWSKQAITRFLLSNTLHTISMPRNHTVSTIITTPTPTIQNRFIIAGAELYML